MIKNIILTGLVTFCVILSSCTNMPRTYTNTDTHLDPNDPSDSRIGANTTVQMETPNRKQRVVHRFDIDILN